MRTALYTSLCALALCASPLSLLCAQEPASEDAPPRGLRLATEAAYEGYTLLAPIQSTTTYLVDMQGEVVHEWESEHPPGVSVYLLDDGSILRCGELFDNERFRGGGIGGVIQRIGWEGELVWNYRFSDATRCQHHDIELLPNGNVLLIAWEYKSPREAVMRGRHPRELDADGFWPDAVYEVRPILPDGGEIVWEWHAWDHLVQELDPNLRGYGKPMNHPGRIDINGEHRHRSEEDAEQRAELEEEMEALGYTGGDDEDEDEPKAPFPPFADFMHTNAIDYEPDLDLIVLSSPEFNELWVIDHSTTSAEAATESGGRQGQGGKILWRWGNPMQYGYGDNDDRQLYYQHNPTWLPGPRLLVFNNGGGRPDGSYSSVDELELPFVEGRGFLRARGRAYPPLQPVWSYTAPEGEEFFGSFISGAERLPNGHTLICEGPTGRVFEVTPEGETVWELWNALGGEAIDRPNWDEEKMGPMVHANALFRASRYAPEHPGLARLQP